MSTEVIKGESPFIESGPGARIYATAFLWFLIGMPICYWIAYPEYPTWLRVAGVCSIVAISLYFIMKNRGWFIRGIARFIGGEAEIEIRSEGIFLERRFGTTHYDWSEVERIELVEGSALDELEFNIVFQLKDGRDIRIESERNWKVVDLMRGWSDGVLDRVPAARGQYTQGGEFIKLKGPNRGHA